MSKCVARLALGAGAAALVIGASAGSAWGITWIEPRDNDAGAVLATALFPSDPSQQGEITGIQGQLNQISPLGGNPSGNPTGFADAQDLFAIQIVNPSGFRAQANSSFGVIDIQLFLFDSTGRGLLANDNQDESVLPRLGPAATDSTFRITQPGLYYLGIAGGGNFPVSGSNPAVSSAIFSYGTPTEISSADGPGGANPLLGWAGSIGAGNYFIELDGANFVPAPSSAGLLVMGGLMAARRRRR